MHLDITFGLQVVERSSLVSLLFIEVLTHPYISLFHLLVNAFSDTCLPPFFNLNDKSVASIITWHCHNVCKIHDKDTKLTSLFLKMSPNSFWLSQGTSIIAQT